MEKAAIYRRIVALILLVGLDLCIVEIRAALEMEHRAPRQYAALRAR